MERIKCIGGCGRLIAPWLNKDMKCRKCRKKEKVRNGRIEYRRRKAKRMAEKEK
jgi:hypothetical protein